MEFNEDGSIKLLGRMKKEKEDLVRKKEREDFFNNFFEENENIKKNKNVDFLSFYKKLLNKKETNFYTLSFFKEADYLGRIESKRNTYHGFTDGTYFLITTGLKAKTTFNIFLLSEVDDFYKFVQSFASQDFTIYDLPDLVKDYSFSSERLNFFVLDHFKYNSEFTRKGSFLYLAFLNLLYCLTLQGKLTLDLSAEKKLHFLKKTFTPDTSKPFFKNFRIVEGKHLECFNKGWPLIRDDRFYFSIREKHFRGTIFPHLEEEIIYLHNLVLNSEEDLLLITDLIKKMDYQKRFIEIYNMVKEQNLRNDREETDYFDSRLKSALEIVNFLFGDVDIIKEGRSYEYRRKN